MALPSPEEGVEGEIVSIERTTIQARARSDALRLLQAINDTQAHGDEGPERILQEQPTKQAWRSAPSVTKMLWRTSSSRPRCWETRTRSLATMLETNTLRVSRSTTSLGGR